MQTTQYDNLKMSIEASDDEYNIVLLNEEKIPFQIPLNFPKIPIYRVGFGEKEEVLNEEPEETDEEVNTDGE